MYARLFVFLVLVIALVCGKQTSDKAVAKAAKKQLKKAMAAYDLKEAQYGYMCLDGGSGPPNCAGNSGKYLSQITTHWEKTAGYCCGACGVDYPDCDCWTFDESSKICTMYHNNDPSKN